MAFYLSAIFYTRIFSAGQNNSDKGRAVIRGIVIAGTNSGCGKTTVSLALMAFFSKKGYRVAPFKVGPDYIDPGHHRRVTGQVSRNLDGWMLTKAWNTDCFTRNTVGCDIALVEGVMGLYDGYSGDTEEGSTAQMAKFLGLPVVLVVNAQSMARSAAAVVQGFENFDPDLRFAGVIFNKIGSPTHMTYLEESLAGHVRMPSLGGIFRDKEVEIPERHLGLITGDEHTLNRETTDRLAELIEEHIDTDTLIANAADIKDSDLDVEARCDSCKPETRIAVARDKAFCFYYEDNLELLESCGAELVYFSPMDDQRLPGDISGIYLGGGYPELFAEELSENHSLMNEIREVSEKGMPVYGECGGFMYLCREITDFQGRVWPMTGCLPLSLRMLDRLKSLGYREIGLQENTCIGKKGLRAKGHEFHYSEVVDSQIEPGVYRVRRRAGSETVREGYISNNTLGSYIHLHFGSNPEVADGFVKSCKQWVTAV